MNHDSQLLIEAEAYAIISYRVFLRFYQLSAAEFPIKNELKFSFSACTHYLDATRMSATEYLLMIEYIEAVNSEGFLYATEFPSRFASCIEQTPFQEMCLTIQVLFPVGSLSANDYRRLWQILEQRIKENEIKNRLIENIPLTAALDFLQEFERRIILMGGNVSSPFGPLLPNYCLPEVEAIPKPSQQSTARGAASGEQDGLASAPAAEADVASEAASTERVPVLGNPEDAELRKCQARVALLYVYSNTVLPKKSGVVAAYGGNSDEALYNQFRKLSSQANRRAGSLKMVADIRAAIPYLSDMGKANAQKDIDAINSRLGIDCENSDR